MRRSATRPLPCGGYRSGPDSECPDVEGQRGLQHNNNSQIVDCLAYEGMAAPLDGLISDLCGVVEDADNLPRCLPLDGLRGSVAHRAVVAHILREVLLAGEVVCRAESRASGSYEASST